MLTHLSTASCQAQRCKGHCGEPCETRWKGPRCLLGAGCQSCRVIADRKGCCPRRFWNTFLVGGVPSLNFQNCQAVCGERWFRALSEAVPDWNWFDWEWSSLVGCGRFGWLFLRHVYQPTFYQCPCLTAARQEQVAENRANLIREHLAAKDWVKKLLMS